MQVIHFGGATPPSTPTSQPSRRETRSNQSHSSSRGSINSIPPETDARLWPQIKTAWTRLLAYLPSIWDSADSSSTDQNNLNPWNPFALSASTTPELEYAHPSLIYRPRGYSDSTDEGLENLARWEKEAFPSVPPTPTEEEQTAGSSDAFLTPIRQARQNQDLSTTEQLEKLRKYHEEGLRSFGRRLSLSSDEEKPESAFSNIYRSLRSRLPWHS